MLKNVPKTSHPEASPRKAFKGIRADDTDDVGSDAPPTTGHQEEARSPFGAGVGLSEENREERAFKKGLNRVLQSTQAYIEAGRAFAKATSSLGNELQEFSSAEWLSGQELAQEVPKVGKLMRSLAAIQEKTMLSVQEACDVPMFQLLDLELQELRTLAEVRSRAEEAAVKTHKRKEKFEGETAAMEKSVTQARSEQETQLLALAGSRNVKVTRFLRALVASEEEFYQMGNHMMTEVQPSIEKLDKRLTELEAAHAKRGVRDGYVWKLSSKSGRWKRVWLVLRNGTLEMRTDKKKKEGRQGRKMNLLISTVRIPMVPADDVAAGAEKKFEFEIVSPERKRGWRFATKREEERAAWIDALQNSIGSLINNQQLVDPSDAAALDTSMRKSGRPQQVGRALMRKVIPGKGHRKTRSVTSAETARAMAMSLMQEGTGQSALVELAAVSGNTKCVDCGKSDPDWASMNLGVLFCLNCSGIHRHLGSHISKVRSLTMDKWPEGTLRYMKCIGNERANGFWEANLDLEVNPKPTPSSSQQERTDFITLKYAKRAFVPPAACDTRPELNAAMFELIQAQEMTMIPESAPVTPSVTPSTTPGMSRKDGSSLADEASSTESDMMSLSNKGSFDGDLPMLTSPVVNTPALPVSQSPPASPVVPVPADSLRVPSGGNVSLLRSSTPPPASSQLGGSPSSSPLRSSSPAIRPASPLQSLPGSKSDLRKAMELELMPTKPLPLKQLKEIIWPLYKLLGWGAEVSAVDATSGKTLAEVLLAHRDPWLLHVFLVHGLEVAVVKEKSGESVLHFAARENLPECLEVLFSSWGGSLLTALEARNSEGQTPADVAKNSASFRVLETLVARHEKEKHKEDEARSPMRPLAVSEAHAGEDFERRKSPRKFGGGGNRDGPSAIEGGDNIGDSKGMQKFIKKATGGHMRSKSVFQPPTHGGMRDSGAKLPTLQKILRKDGGGGGPAGTAKRGAQPGLSSKGTTGYGEQEHGDAVKIPSAASVPAGLGVNRAPTTGIREEVVVREGKNPLMKGKGLDLSAIKEARVNEAAESSGDVEKLRPEKKVTRSLDSSTTLPDMGDPHRDLLGFISSSSSEDEL